MSPKYPRIDDARQMDPWIKRRRAALPKAQDPHKCCVCGEPATHRVFVEVNWFRGDDEGPFKTCKLHRRSAADVLASHQGNAA